MVFTVQNIITKFLANEASAEELEILEKWIENPENEKVFLDFIKTNSLVELAVGKTGSGDWSVQFRQAIIDDHWDPIQSWALDSIADIADYEQISLSLFNGEAGGEEFSAPSGSRTWSWL